MPVEAYEEERVRQVQAHAAAAAPPKSNEPSGGGLRLEGSVRAPRSGLQEPVGGHVEDGPHHVVRHVSLSTLPSTSTRWPSFLIFRSPPASW